MAPSKLILLLFPFVFQIFVISRGQALVNFCVTTSNFTTNSPYQKNLNGLISAVSSAPIPESGFYNSSFGESPDIAYSIGLCRGDVKPDACRTCLNFAAKNLTSDCPNQKEAVIFYDDCMFRYANRSIVGLMEFGPYIFMHNVNNASDVNQFNKDVKTLLTSLINPASAGDTLRKFAAGTTKTASSGSIYGLTQCTPDLSKAQCTDCLTKAVDLLPQCCAGSKGGRVLTPSCHFRYEVDQFYDSVANAPSPIAMSPKSSESPSPESSVLSPPRESSVSPPPGSSASPPLPSTLQLSNSAVLTFMVLVVFNFIIKF